MHQNSLRGLHLKSFHQQPQEERWMPRFNMLLTTLIILSVGCIQAAPLFDFLPPVIIDEDQRITTNNNAHSMIFFPIGKYATDVHYQIIRIPIHLQPVKQGLKSCGEVLHHMNNAIVCKATEIPIKDIIKVHNDTLHRVNFNYNNMLKNLPEAPFTPYLILFLEL
jgi:hypothetical protein